MKKYITFLFLLALTISCSAQGIEGNWKGKMTTPDGDFELRFTFNVNGDSLTGTSTSEWATLPLEHGKVNGNQFSFDVTVNGQVISSTGVLDGDVIKLSSPFMEKPMELARVMESAKIDGVWKGKATSPQGEFELTFTFKVDGNKLIGKNSSAMGEIDLTNGVVNGSDFSFDVDVQGMTISHKCKYQPDDTIDVKADVMDQVMDMKLTRAQ